MAHKQPGLDGRHRNADGRISEKHGNTLARTVRVDHPNFAPGTRGDTKLSTVREREGGKSLTQILRGK